MLFSMPNRMPVVAKIACIVGFVSGGLGIISALAGQIVLLPFALTPLIAAIGIVRRRVWSAYGFAVYLLAQLLLVPVVLLWSRAPRPPSAGILVQTAVSVALIALFAFAGRSLAAAGSPRGWAWPWIAFSVLIVIPLFFVQPFVIPTAAMEETLLVGDRILVQYFPKPGIERGEIIAFIYPVDRSQSYVKRVIGVPGDHIKIVGKIVYRNGAPLQEPYVVHTTEYVDSYRDNFPSEPNGPFADAARDMLQKNVVNGEVVVPEGKYFVLGDNRDNSLDSRYWGFIGPGDVIGTPRLIYDSVDQSTDQIAGNTSPLPRHRRWDRLFKLL
jgi:signal peptidase I